MDKGHCHTVARTAADFGTAGSETADSGTADFGIADFGTAVANGNVSSANNDSDADCGTAEHMAAVNTAPV